MQKRGQTRTTLDSEKTRGYLTDEIFGIEAEPRLRCDRDLAGISLPVTAPSFATRMIQTKDAESRPPARKQADENMEIAIGGSN